MKSNQLHDLWTSPDNSRLTSKQFSFRLPVHIAAKIAALCDIYPQKNRTQIVADLLTGAIDDLEKHLPEGIGEPVEAEWSEEIGHQLGEREPLFYLGGARGKFRNFANRHYFDLERELGNESLEALYPNLLVTKAELTKSDK